MKQERIELTRPAMHVWRAAAATLRAHVDGISTQEAVKRMYGDDYVMPTVQRAATGPAMINDSGTGWAGPLGRYAVSQAIEDIVSMSAIGRLLESGGLRVDMGRLASMTIPGRQTTAAAAGAWTAEGAAKPVHQYTILAAKLVQHKLEVITTFTWEMANASNIEDILRVLLSEAAGLAIDAAVFSTTAASAARSAGLLNGLTAQTASTTTGFDGCGQDLGTLVGDIASRGGGRRASFIASPAQATAIRFWAGGQFDIAPGGGVVLPVEASAALAAGTVVCIEPESFACSFGAPEFSIANVAALHMEDTTPADITGPTGTLAFPVKSMFQTDAIALKMTLWGDWCVRAPHVSYMTSVAW